MNLLSKSKNLYLYLFLCLFSVLFSTNCHSSSNLKQKRKKILYLGDSLSYGTYGKFIERELSNDGIDVYLSVTGGGNPYYWLSSHSSIPSTSGYWFKTPSYEQRVYYKPKVPKIDFLLDKYNPDIVVIQCGTNLYASLRSKRRTKRQNIREVTRLIDEMCQVISKQNKRIFWITPPDSHQKKYPRTLQNQLLSIIKKTVKKYGEVFDSSKVTRYTQPYPREDGIHYGPSQSKKWAEKTLVELKKFIRNNHVDINKKAYQANKRSIKQKNDSLSFSYSNIKNTKPKEKIKLIKNINVSEIDAVTIFNSSISHKNNNSNINENKVVKNDNPVDTKIEKNKEKKKNTFIPVEKPIILKLELLEKTVIPHLSDANYSKAFAVFEYKVKNVLQGKYPFKTVRVAHMAIMNKKFTAPHRFKLGKKCELEIVPLDLHPRLKRIEIFDNLTRNFELPIYICNYK